MYKILKEIKLHLLIGLILISLLIINLHFKGNNTWNIFIFIGLGLCFREGFEAVLKIIKKKK